MSIEPGHRRAAQMAVAAALAIFVATPALTCAQEMPANQNAEIVNADPGSRFDPTDRPANPQPQHPPLSTPENTDTHKPPHEWQRATDDWMGSRPWLEDHGISLNATLSLDISRSVRGGTSTRDTATGTIFDANLTLDTAKLFHLDGGTFFINFQSMSGSKTSIAGTVQTPTDAEIETRTQISELWYEQRMLGEKFRLKLGKIDANNNFSHIEASSDFLNGSMAYSPTIFGLPTNPDPAVGLVAFFYPAENIYAGIGLFDGSTVAGRPTGAHGLMLSHVPNFFMIAEAGGTWTLPGRRDGHFGVGVWHVTGDLPRFDGGHDSGATGPYAFIEQTLWRPTDATEEDDDRGITFFLQYGQADGSISPIKQHIGGGIAWTGPLPGRDLDVAGIGFTSAVYGSDPAFIHTHEFIAETFYRLRLTKFFSMKPDLQYVHNPAEARRDALVVSLQMIMDF